MSSGTSSGSEIGTPMDKDSFIFKLSQSLQWILRDKTYFRLFTILAFVVAALFVYYVVLPFMTRNLTRDDFEYTGDVNDDGKAHGKGRVTHINGDYQDGQFENGICVNGKHVSIRNKYTYEGEFGPSSKGDQGVYNGKGVRTHEDGTKYEGEWKDGQLHGSGKIIWPHEDGRVSTYEGSFEKHYFNGQGKITYGDGRVMEGVFQGGTFSKPNLFGNGVYILANGSKFAGTWRNGNMERGKFVFSSGNIFEGTFSEGKMKEGSLFLKDQRQRGGAAGVTYRAIFDGGDVISEGSRMYSVNLESEDKVTKLKGLFTNGIFTINE